MTMHKPRFKNVISDVDFLRVMSYHPLIAPFQETSLSGCSYDLTAGNEIISKNKSKRFKLQGSQEYFIESGECVTVRTEEKINLKKVDLFGVIINKHTLVGKGLFHPTTKIDPGFEGYLAITLINIGNDRIPIKRGDRICSLFFYALSGKPNLQYGANLKPTFREGSIDISLISEKSGSIENESNLSKMYGEPVRRLYEKINKIEENLELHEYRSKETKREKNFKIAFDIIKLIVSAVLGALAVLLIQKWKLGE